MMSTQTRPLPAKPWAITPLGTRLKPSAIREILKIASQPGYISFAGGLPAPEMFPLAEFRKIMPEVLDTYGSESLQYTLTRGIVPLRDLMAQRATARGSATTRDNIFITSGSQQGLYLVGQALLSPNDAVVVENPSYIGALQIFKFLRSKLVPVEMDENGIRVEGVEQAIRQHQIKMIYVVPDFQNPTGVSLSSERRHRLVELAREHNIPLIDDSPYGDLRFAGEKLPSLKSIGGETVIALRTFSKLTVPGLRLAWLNAPEWFLTAVERLKQAADLHSNTFGQYVLYEYLKRGLLEPHIEAIRADYSEKRELMLSVLESEMPSSVTWTRPEGGLFLWVTLPRNLSASELLKKTLEAKIAFVPGQPFYPNEDVVNTLRLNFSNASLISIREGISRLAEIIKAELNSAD